MGAHDQEAQCEAHDKDEECRPSVRLECQPVQWVCEEWHVSVLKCLLRAAIVGARVPLKQHHVVNAGTVLPDVDKKTSVLVRLLS